MLGLGKGLIRAALDDSVAEGASYWHLRPANFHQATQTLGVYMHPASCQILVFKEDLGTMEQARRRKER